MTKFLNKLISPIRSARANILTSAFIAMVILSMSVAGLAQLTVNQYTVAKQKIETINQDILGEALLEQAMYEFETYLQANDWDFEGYFTSKTTAGMTSYGVMVEDVSTLTDVNGSYVDYDGISNIVMRFTYTYNEGVSRMVSYVHLTTKMVYAEPVDPFDFQMATNGHLILSGGYFRQPQIFGHTIVYNNRAAYYNTITNQQSTTGQDVYTDYSGNASQALTYFGSSLLFCEQGTICYDTTGTLADPLVLQTNELLDVVSENPAYIETGGVNEDKIITDFFGSFSLPQRIINYVSDDGPTADLSVTSPMNLSTIGATIWASESGDPEETCENVQKNKNKPPIWECYYGASSEPYTRMNGATGFDPATTATELDFAGIYQGNLTIGADFTMTNLDEPGTSTETMIVDGDLTIDNTGDITISAFIVVLGDLYFTGDNVTVSGGFYVTGQTYMQFNDGEGFENINGQGYSFALLTMDNIIVESLFRHNANAKPGNATTFNWFVYTEESLFIDAVNNQMAINGVLFAAAKGNSGNEIPIEDELGNPIRGIVVQAFDGYIRSNGTETYVNNHNSFDFDPMQEASLQDEFIQLPEFELLAVSEGDGFTTYRTDIFYNND